MLLTGIFLGHIYTFLEGILLNVLKTTFNVFVSYIVMS